MLAKILITVGIVVGALMALRVLGRAADARISRTEQEAREAAQRKVKGEDYVQCPSCGDYKPRNEPCGCGAEF